MSEVEYKKGQYSVTYHGSLGSLLREIEKDLKDQAKSRYALDDKGAREYDAKKEAIMYTITSIKDIENILLKIYSLPSRLQSRYNKELNLLNEERTRLLDLLFMEINGFSDFKYRESAKKALISAKRVFAHYDKNYADMHSNKANEEINKKRNDKKSISNIYIEELDSLQELIQELDYLVLIVDKTNPIKEEVSKELRGIKRVFPPRVISTSKEVVDRLEELEERQLVLDYLEMIDVPFTKVDKEYTRTFERKIKDIPYDERSLFKENTKTSKVLKKVSKLLRKTYLELSKEQEKTEKEKDNLSDKKKVIGKGLNDATAALHNYKFSLIKNDEDIKARKKAEELYPSKEYKDLDDSVIKAHIRLQSINPDSKEAQELREYIDETNKELDRLDAQREEDKKREPRITSLDSNYTNMEEKLEDVKRL